jgi:hypothetical protein
VGSLFQLSSGMNLMNVSFRDRCLSIMTREDRAEFHRRLDEARELWSREDPDLEYSQPPQENITFNVAFTAIYANNSVEGGYVP